MLNPRLRREDEVERIETNIEIGAQSEIDRRTRRRAKHRVENETNRRRSKPRTIRRSNDLQRETSSRRKSSRTSLHEDKSMLKHIMKTCKVVSYVDTETWSGTHVSSRRSSRTTPARLHRACTVERLNSNIEEPTKHNTADLFTKH